MLRFVIRSISYILDKLHFVNLTENAFTTTKSKESDVYSYGVVLLELITRKKALDSSFCGERDIVNWVRSLWTGTEEIEHFVDPSLLHEFIDSNIRDQVLGVLLLAVRCTEKEPNKRPSIRDVVKQLKDTRSNSTLRSRKN